MRLLLVIEDRYVILSRQITRSPGPTSLRKAGVLAVMSKELMGSTVSGRRIDIPHPIPYQGSKRGLAQDILRFFPADSARLIEPFAGSAAVSLAAAHGGDAHNFSLSDVDRPLARLWQSIIDEPGKLSDKYEELWNEQLGREREYYDYVRTKFNSTYEPEYLLYLLARCVKAAVRYNAKGYFNQSPDNRRRGSKPATMRAHIMRAAELLAEVTTVQASDFRSALSEVTDVDIVYMDPPYQGVSNGRDRRYVAGLPLEEFADTLKNLNERRVSYVLSYDGYTGVRRHGVDMPEQLNLVRLEIDAGRSSSATLHGRHERTYESLYLSPALVGRLDDQPTVGAPTKQLALGV